MRAAGHATRERILAAARDEFARYGMAGARINRIATRARASKDRLYAYFPGKEELFGEVTRQWIAETVAAAALRGDDVPGYVGRLFDHYRDHPENARLQSWAELELAPDAPPEGVAERERAHSGNDVNLNTVDAGDAGDGHDRGRGRDWGRDATPLDWLRAKAGEIRRGQREGHIDPDWDPVDLLVMLAQLARSMAVPSSAIAGREGHGEQARRQAAVEAARRLIEPSHSAQGPPASPRTGSPHA